MMGGGAEGAWRLDAMSGERSLSSRMTASSSDDGIPSSLEDAVMRELSERSPDMASSRQAPSAPPPIIEPSALRKRSSNPPADHSAREPSEDRVALPSLPHDAMVPATT